MGNHHPPTEIVGVSLRARSNLQMRVALCTAEPNFNLSKNCRGGLTLAERISKKHYKCYEINERALTEQFTGLFRTPTRRWATQFALT